MSISYAVLASLHSFPTRRSSDLMRHPKDLGPFIRDEVRQEYREWLERRRTEIRREQRPNRGLRALSREDGFVAMNWEATSPLGIRRSRSEEHTSELQSHVNLVCRPRLSTLFPYTTLFRSDAAPEGSRPLHPR